MSSLHLALVIAGALSSGAGVLCVIAGSWYFRRRPAVTDEELAVAFPKGVPLVSILKPCKGDDPELYENLCSFLQVDPIVPCEVLFGVADERDPAAAVIQRAIVAHPGVPARLVITGERRDCNPKVTSLCLLDPHVRGELVLVSDSNVRASPTMLRRLVLPFADDQVALSYSLQRGTAPRSLGARIAAALTSTLILPSLGGAYVMFGVANLIGKNMMIRHSTFTRLGGWERYQRYLLEDGLIGRDLRRVGYRAVLSPEPIDVVMGEMTLRVVFSQQQRWAVLHRFTFPMVPLAELTWNPWVLALGAVACAASGSDPAAMLLAMAAAAKLGAGIVALGELGGRWRDAWVLPLMEAFRLAVVLSVWATRDVVWRGQRFRLGAQTLILSTQPVATPPTKR